METDWGDAPSDWDSPDWESAGGPHDWKNYISKHVRRLWQSFTSEQKVALAAQADEQADREEWD